MHRKLKFFKYIKYLVDILYIIFVFTFGLFLLFKIPNLLYKLDFVSISLVVAIVLILYRILSFISIIFHELGHLVFGLIAKLTFSSFSILNYTIFIENNNLKIKKTAKIPGVNGYCSMNFEKHKKKSIILYLLGGIIFNLIFGIISIILMIFTNNVYLNLIYILNIGINIYLVIYNSIPHITKSGFDSDSLQIIYYLNDNKYIETINKLQILNEMLANGCALKDIDIKYFYNPQTFKTISDIKCANIYVDYLSSKGQYKEARTYAKKVLNKAKDIIPKNYIISFKLQIINCIFYSGDDLNKIKEVWDKDIKKYLDLMGKIVPFYIGINYMYATLIEKNESDSQKYLNQFHKLNKTKHNEYLIKSTEQLINMVNEKINQ